MEIEVKLGSKELSSEELILISAFCKKEAPKKKTDKESMKIQNSHWPKDYKEAFAKVKIHDHFHGNTGEAFKFILEDGSTVVAVGLGEKSKVSYETLRREFAKSYKIMRENYETVSVHLDSFIIKSKFDESLTAILEGIYMAAYKFETYLSNTMGHILKTVYLESSKPKSGQKKANQILTEVEQICESINFTRDLVNEPPNVLHSEEFAKRVEADAKKLKGVKIKVLNKKDIEKEKMGMFLAVNQGSHYEPRLVHLTYTPPKATKKTKHVALVGKGLTFDTGGYSLKPAASIINMKFDMAGAATVYGAFRAAVLTGCPVKLSCYLGMTDNAINEKAILPDSIVKARNGKSVKILNTDAEGRLVLGDVIDYACDHNPDYLIDAATLTGACLISLGTEVCGLMGNDQKFCDSLLKSAKASDEYMWQLPIIPEYANDMKGTISDLKNIGSNRFGGTSKAAAFLQEFVQEGVKWSHLDIAGIGDSQSYLPYCPQKGGSGLIVRTLNHFIKNVK